jgi:hypothetical protein
MKYAVEMGSGDMIYLPSFIKIDTGLQAILRFCVRNLTGCNVGITDGRDLRSAPLRWAQVAYLTENKPCLHYRHQSVNIV